MISVTHWTHRQTFFVVAVLLVSLGVISQLSNSVTGFAVKKTLPACPSITGDFNDDGFVNVKDLSLLKTALQKMPQRCLQGSTSELIGDFDDNGKLNQRDYLLLKTKITVSPQGDNILVF